MFTMNSKVGEVVAKKSCSSRVFEKYKIDYCCKGNLTVGEACEKKGIDVQIVLDELKNQGAVEPDEKSWSDAPLSELVDHIQNTYHNFLWEELPKLRTLVEKVANVHGAKQPHLCEIRVLYCRLQQELEEHMRKEENRIFPAIKKNDHAALGHLIAELEQEHDKEGELLSQLRVLANDFIPPSHACSSHRAMLGRLQELESNMHQHVHKENSILFPRVRISLT